ncbi:alpha/beta fold hydrolase [Desulfobacterales bacterium HSG16]|nr:alpha/beta fold hydrolase [Desulfobacterales bacterium HSG16]
MIDYRNNEHKSSQYEEIQLFCIPFAAGTAYSYRDIESRLDSRIKPVGIDLPGHGRKMGQPLFTDIGKIFDHVFTEIKKQLNNRPFAIFGHSMGATLTYLMAKKLRDENMPQPLHLFVSGRQGPPVPSKEKGIHLLPDAQFLDKVIELGGISDEVAGEQELIELFLPILKADYHAITTYEYDKKAKPLDIPITAMIGTIENFTPEEATTWQEVTSRPLDLKKFLGHHFFIFDHCQDIADIISKKLLDQPE